MFAKVTEVTARFIRRPGDLFPAQTGRGRYLQPVVAALLVVAGLMLLTRPYWTGVEEQGLQRKLAAAADMQDALTPSASPSASAQDPSATTSLAPAGGWRPPGPTPPVYGHLTIPTLGLDVYVVDGATLTYYYDLLAWGPAHITGTAQPGDAGNAVLVGHRDEFGSPFRNLFRLKAGDSISLTRGDKRFDYRVLRIWPVDPTDVSVLAPDVGAKTKTLTLITCTGPGNLQRLVVRAALSEAPAGGPAA